MRWKIRGPEILAAAAFLVAAGVVSWLVFATSGGAADETVYRKVGGRELSGRMQGKFKPAARRAAARAVRRPAPAADDDTDENGVKLTPEMKQILAELQDCMDNDDRKALSKVCEKISAIQRARGNDAVPASVRAKAVEAIGLFLPASLAELVDFMTDSDPDVLSSVFDQIDNLLNDTTIGDRELSDIFTSLAKVMSDEDAIDSMVLSIESGMRNSVRVKTCKAILDTGSDAVVSRLRESIAEMLEVEV